MREGFWVGGRRYVVLSGDVGSFDVYEDPCRLGFHFGQHGAFDTVEINPTSAFIQDYFLQAVGTLAQAMSKRLKAAATRIKAPSEKLIK